MAGEFLIPITLFALIFGIVYLFIRRKERLTLIEKGVNATIFEPLQTGSASLKWGLLFVGIGIGILLGRLLIAYTCIEEPVAYFSMICLFGGIGLIVYYLISKSLMKKNNLKEKQE
jgi:preprotein translocase subunit YajC